MKIRLEDLKNDQANAAERMLQWTGSKYRNFSDYVAFREGDPIGLLIFKLFLRFIGVFFMLLLSPFLILGLIIAFAAVF